MEEPAQHRAYRPFADALSKRYLYSIFLLRSSEPMWQAERLKSQNGISCNCLVIAVEETVIDRAEIRKNK
jgi:hypothetical protein